MEWTFVISWLVVLCGFAIVLTVVLVAKRRKAREEARRIADVKKDKEKKEFRGFTIEVGKKGKDEKFGFADLELFHRECYGGQEISLRMEPTDRFTSTLPLNWEIRIECERCKTCVRLPSSSEEEIKISLVRTAIDGQERKIAEQVRIIQRP